MTAKQIEVEWCSRLGWNRVSLSMALLTDGMWCRFRWQFVHPVDWISFIRPSIYPSIQSWVLQQDHLSFLTRFIYLLVAQLELYTITVISLDSYIWVSGCSIWSGFIELISNINWIWRNIMTLNMDQVMLIGPWPSYYWASKQSEVKPSISFFVQRHIL